MSKNDYIIRLERKQDYRQVENLVRESFWNVYRLNGKQIMHQLIRLKLLVM